MALLNPGYWQSTYWQDSYWQQDFWPEYGIPIAPTETIRQQIIDAIDARFKTIGKYGLGEGPLGEYFLGGEAGDSIRQQIIDAIDARLKTIL